MSEFTLAELAAEARREVVLRKHVYKGLIARGKLGQLKADKQIAMMEAVAEYLEELHANQLNLFDGKPK